jgi:diol dehydratase reactivase alpha subunit
MIIAGIDVGNSTTEVAIANISAARPDFLGTSRVPTTGIKGTSATSPAWPWPLRRAAEDAGISVHDIDLALLNEATPVIGDIAMETITETIITESTMIGHNPGSPGGMGIGVGQTVHIKHLVSVKRGEAVIVVVPKDYDFELAASLLRRAMEAGVDVQGGIVQSDDGVLIANRLPRPIPLVDEVG